MIIKRPMLIAAVLLLLCVIAVFYCETSIFAAIIFLSLLVAANLFYFKNAKFTVVLLCVAISVVSLSGSLLKIQKVEMLSLKTVSGDFVISETPYYNGNSFVAKAVCISSKDLAKGDKIKLYYENATLNVGDKTGVSVKIYRVENPTQKKSLYSENIYLTGYVSEFKRVKTNDNFLCFLPRLRKNIKNILNSARTTYAAKSLASAVLIGDKGQFSNEFEDLVKRAGVSHVFVVSGMHLVILMGSVLKMFERIFYNKYFCALISICGVFLFSLVCGFTMSILRAAVMYVILAMAQVFGRDNDPLNSVGTAVCLISFFSPYAIFSVAFQLSVLSTLGILLLTDFLSEKICGIFKIKKKFPKSVVNAISVSVSAIIMTAPVCVYYFEYLSCVSIVTNLLITYVINYMILLNAIGIVLGLVFGSTFISSAFLYVGDIFSEYSIKVIKDFGSLKYSAVSIPKQTTAVFIVIALCVVFISRLDKRRNYIISRRV